VAFVFDKYSTAAPPCCLRQKVVHEHKSHRITGRHLSKGWGM